MCFKEPLLYFSMYNIDFQLRHTYNTHPGHSGSIGNHACPKRGLITETESCNLWSKRSTSKPPRLDTYNCILFILEPEMVQDLLQLTEPEWSQILETAAFSGELVIFYDVLTCFSEHWKPREGVIIEWPLNDLFNISCVLIISSRMAVIIIF